MYKEKKFTFLEKWLSESGNIKKQHYWDLASFRISLSVVRILKYFLIDKFQIFA